MKLPKRLLLVLVACGLVTSIQSAPDRNPRPEPAGLAPTDWPGFRGPGAAAASQESNLPTTWNETENLVWKTRLPGAGGSSPIVLGDRVFVTCYTGYGLPGEDAGDQKSLRRQLLCLDRKSGNVLWKKESEARLPEATYGRFTNQHGYASSTPATDGERVYVFFGTAGVYAFDLDGKKLWQVSVGTKTHNWGSAASPVLYKGLVIINAGVECGALVALDKKTGNEVWKAPGIQKCWGTPVLVDGAEGKQELVVSVPKNILGLDPDTGKRLWRCDGIDDYICPSVATRDGAVYAIGGRKNTALAVKAGGRGDDVTASHRLWTNKVGSNVCSPLIQGDYLYWINDNGIAYCLKAKTGEQVSSERLAGSGRVYASAVAADGKLYVVSREKGTYVLAAEPKLKQLAHNTFSGDKSIFNGSPAISKGQLFLRSDKYLYCIGTK
jgi:outer membrane protein assembly factor BamB